MNANPRGLATRSGDEKQTPFVEGKTRKHEGANNANWTSRAVFPARQLRQGVPL